MMQECIDVFKVKYDRENKSSITDNYSFSPGIYLVVDIDSGEIFEEYKFEKKEQPNKDSFYYELAFFDYNSRLVSMNKPIDSTKTIHSNNYLSFFVKNEGKLTTEKIDTYFKVLENPEKKYEGKKEQTAIYKQFLENNSKPNEKTLSSCKKWIENNIFTLLEKHKIDLKKNYLKIFFAYKSNLELSRQSFETEGNRYLFPNIFNDTKYNIKIGDITYGMPGANLGLNAKKVFLANKTRINEVPYLLSTEDVLIQKLFFDYLETLCNAGKNYIYIDTVKNEIIGYKWLELPERDNFTGIFLYVRKSKEIEIHDMDVVPNIVSKLEPPIAFLNYLQVDTSKITEDNKKSYPLFQLFGRETTQKAELADLIDRVFFSGAIRNNSFTDSEDVKVISSIPQKSKLLFLSFRNNYKNWFYKNEISRFIQDVDKLLLKHIHNEFERTKINQYYRLQQMLILRETVLSYYLPENIGGKTMAVKTIELKSICEKVEKIILTGDGYLETDAEFYYAVGQLTGYLLSLSKAQYVTLEPAVEITKKKNADGIRSELQKLVRKYAYAIKLWDNSSEDGKKKRYGVRFGNLNTACNDYELQENFEKNNQYLIIGITSENIFYSKNEKKEGNENE